MAMSKKDLIALADAIRSHNQSADNHSLAQRGSTLNSPFTPVQLDTLADFCRSQNARFMRERWLGYISGENGKNGGAIRPKS
jgi:hypothetical protein